VTNRAVDVIDDTSEGDGALFPVGFHGVGRQAGAADERRDLFDATGEAEHIDACR